jgi:hypothetical protein
MQNRWAQLTIFLRVAGAPLDNNLCERALKKAILHRKNSMFFKIINGARVGDIFMSLIHTAELGNVEPFDYLNCTARAGGVDAVELHRGACSFRRRCRHERRLIARQPPLRILAERTR